MNILPFTPKVKYHFTTHITDLKNYQKSGTWFVSHEDVDFRTEQETISLFVVQILYIQKRQANYALGYVG